MHDKLIIGSYLLILKSTMEVYVHGTLESSNERVREVLKQGLESTLSSQGKTYNLMVENNWYQVNNVENNVINETLNKISQNNE